MNYSTEQEIWKDVIGFEGRYKISDHGRVYSLLTNKILKNNVDQKGYEFVLLRKNNQSHYWQVHRLVAIHFIENPNNLPIINHKDENPRNNRVDNLEWCTYKYNMYYSFYRKHGRYPNPRPRNKTGRKAKRKIIGRSIEDGTVIKLPSITSCIEHGFARTCVKDCLSGKQKTHKGFVWEYAD